MSAIPKSNTDGLSRYKEVSENPFKRESDKRLTIKQLSDDLLFQIFTYLSPKSIGKNARLVCKQWHSISLNKDLWQRIATASGISDKHIKRSSSPFHANVNMSIPEQLMIEKIEQFDPLVPPPFESVKDHLRFLDLIYDERVRIIKQVDRKIDKDYQKGLYILFKIWIKTSRQYNYVPKWKDQIKSTYTKTCITSYGRYFRKQKQTSQEQRQELQDYTEGVESLIFLHRLTQQALHPDVCKSSEERAKKWYLEQYNNEDAKLHPVERELLIARGKFKRRSGMREPKKEAVITPKAEKIELNPRVYTKEAIYAKLSKYLTPKEMKERVVCLEIEGKTLVLIGERHDERFDEISLPFRTGAVDEKCAYFQEGYSEKALKQPRSGLLYERGYFYGIENHAESTIAHMCSYTHSLKTKKNILCTFGSDTKKVKERIFSLLISASEREILKEIAAKEDLHPTETTILARALLQTPRLSYLSPSINAPSINDNQEHWVALCYSALSIMMNKYNLSTETKEIILNVLAHPEDPTSIYNYQAKILAEGRNQGWQQVLLSKIASLPADIVSVGFIGGAHLKGLVQELMRRENAKLQLLGEYRSENYIQGLIKLAYRYGDIRPDEGVKPGDDKFGFVIERIQENYSQSEIEHIGQYGFQLQENDEKTAESKEIIF